MELHKDSPTLRLMGDLFNPNIEFKMPLGSGCWTISILDSNAGLGCWRRQNSMGMGVTCTGMLIDIGSAFLKELIIL